MRRSRGIRFALVAVAVGAAALWIQPASAASTGYITLQSVSTQTLATSGEAVTDSYQGFINCTWAGGSNFNGTCTTANGIENIAGSSVPVGNLQQIAGVIGPGPIFGTLNGFCTTAGIAGPGGLRYDENCHFVVN